MQSAYNVLYVTELLNQDVALMQHNELSAPLKNNTVHLELEDYIDYRDEEKWGYRKMRKVV